MADKTIEVGDGFLVVYTDQGDGNYAPSVSISTGTGEGATVGVVSGAAVTSDANGTLQQYLRGLVKILADVWSSTIHFLKVSPVAADGNASEFSCAVVGAHSSGADISSKATLTKPEGATGILIQAITQNACYTLDGTDPTSTKGFVIYAGMDPYIIPVPGAAIEIIQAAATCRLEYQWVK